jgi:DNA polymerase III alpha subunit
MFKKAVADKMPAIAITDHGNMFGVFEFVAEAAKHKDVKPIVGCEFYLVEDRHKRAFTKEQKDKRFHQLFLAKNAEGYRNLTKMCSLGFIEGLYGKYPRIDKELILQYHKGLIATTCCLGAEVPQAILMHGEAVAREKFKWWLNLFGEDYYVELQRHQIPDQIKVNEVLLRFAKEFDVKIIASNDSHYVDRADSNAHDILLCLNTGEKQATPKMDDFDEGVSQKGKRFAFFNDEFYFKTTAEMQKVFPDLPQALDNTNEIVAKIEPLKLKRDILLPNFVIPQGFTSQDEYLTHLTFEGAKERYKEISPIIEERLNFELFTVRTMGFAGYFLIVADFIKAGRDLGVFIGPGRGCLVGNTKIILRDGRTKNLEHIEIGDKVWTQDGSLQTVTNRFEYPVDETLLNIKNYYGEADGVTMTKDHKVLAEKQKNNELTWMPASDLEIGDWVFIPTPVFDSKNAIPIDYNLVSKRNSVNNVPNHVLKGNDSQIIDFLKRHVLNQSIESDSHFNYTTFSRSFADQIRFICWQINVPVKLNFDSENNLYQISISNIVEIGHCPISTRRMISNQYRKVKGGILTKIRSITEVTDVKKVYDIEVSNNHNYLTSSFLVHNSAAGSAIAYCIGITNIDPIKYNLLFERFLNPDRKSMPDIDTDFDDEGRQKVIDYVVQKYGKQQVAQITTYGTMAAKMSIKDVARVLDLPLQEANAMVKLVSDKPGIKLNRLLTAPIYGEGSLSEKENLIPEDIENAKSLREILNGDDERAKVLKEALILEGSVRGTGIHAAGIIIAPKDLTEIIPVYTSKETELLITQFEGSIIEDAGVIKMDFLGLKTLSIMRDALKLIKENYGITIEIDEIPLDDKKTYQLYQRGETNATFQFESPGMQKHLRDLKPDKFDDLIAMNALYRPGPLQYIPNYINRKHGREKVVYDLDAMEEYLHETYGICIFQEQLMLLSQKLANFSKGDADVLRKAMGKKQLAVLDKMKPKFLAGCEKNGHALPTCEKIWTDWEAFASYAFNKSHSTCYAFVAFQTGYLKAHYPGEYMAAVLTHGQGNLEKITFFMEECRSMGIAVKSPDVNESDVTFTVNKKGEIRYALAAAKGVGEAAVNALIEERKENGAYKDVFDFVRRSNSRTISKKVIESLVYAGAMDGFGIHRATYFAKPDPAKQDTFIEMLIKYGNAYQSQKDEAKVSLFGGGSNAVMTAPPAIPKVEEWNLIEKLNYEKEVVGIFLSGHPLDDFRMQVKVLEKYSLDKIENFKGQKVKLAAFVTAVNERISKKGTPWGAITIQDYKSSTEFTLFNDDYARHAPILKPGTSVYIEGEYKTRYNSTEYELKINTVKLLDSVSVDNLVNNVTIVIPLERITHDFIETMTLFCSKFKGKSKLRVQIQDATNHLHLKLYSLDKNVKIDTALLKYMDSEGWQYSLN